MKEATDKGHVLYNSMYRKYSERANPETNEINGCRGEWGVTANRRGVSFRDDENIPEVVVSNLVHIQNNH